MPNCRSIPGCRLPFVIRNTGTVDVGRVRLGGSLANFRVIHVFPGDAPGYELEPAEGDRPTTFHFREIPRLAAGESLTVSLELAGLRPGRAMTSATLTYVGADNEEDGRVVRVVHEDLLGDADPGDPHVPEQVDHQLEDAPGVQAP